MARKKSQTQVRKEAVEKKRQRQNRLRLLGGGLVGLVLLGIAIFSFVQTQLPTAEVDVAALPVAPEIGALAPDFELSGVDGNLVRLSDFRGQPVVLTFMHTW